MGKNTEETPGPRRATYIDANTGQESGIDLDQTIAQARAAQVEELQAKLGEAEATIAQKQEIIDSMAVEISELQVAFAERGDYPHGIELGAYAYADDETEDAYTVVQIDTIPETGRVRVYINDGVIYDDDPENEGAEEPVTEESEPREVRFFNLVARHLAVHDAGTVAIVNEVERRSHVDRAAYIASLERITEAMQQNTDNLRDLTNRSRSSQLIIRD